MNDLDLDAIRARVDAATQDIGDGWEAVEGTYEDNPEVWATTPHRRFVASVIDTDEELVRPVNPVLAFIAAAPGDVRSLIDEVQRRDDALAAVLALPLLDEVDDWTAGYAAGLLHAHALIAAAVGGDR